MHDAPNPMIRAYKQLCRITQKKRGDCVTFPTLIETKNSG